MEIADSAVLDKKWRILDRYSAGDKIISKYV